MSFALATCHRLIWTQGSPRAAGEVYFGSVLSSRPAREPRVLILNSACPFASAQVESCFELSKYWQQGSLDRGNIYKIFDLRYIRGGKTRSHHTAHISYIFWSLWRRDKRPDCCLKLAKAFVPIALFGRINQNLYALKTLTKECLLVKA